MPRTPRPSPAEVVSLRRSLDGAFRRGWQGPALLGSLRGVRPAEALVVPAGLKHGIWSIVLHAAYWKYAVALRLSAAGVEVAGLEPRSDARGRAASAFPRSPSNWPTPPTEPDARQWRADVALLKSWHLALMDALPRVPAAALDRIPPGGRTWTLGQTLAGIAAHDAYHCGQVQLLKRLVRAGG